MSLARRATLLCLCLAAAISFLAGFRARSASAGFDPTRLYAATGRSLGPFVVEAVKPRAGAALQLRSAGCDRPLYLRIAALADPPPDELVALLYPPSEWRTLYVYRGEPSDTFDRIHALVRYDLLSSLAALDLTTAAPAEAVVFVLHWPRECSISPQSAVDATAAGLEMANGAPSNSTR